MAFRPARVAFVALLFSCFFLTGCVDERVDGEAITYKLQLYIPILTLLAALGAAALGFMLHQKSWRYWLLSLGGFICLIAVVPGLFLEKVSVTPKGFDMHTGFWFTPNSHSIRFGDLNSIDITSKTSTGRRGRKSRSFYLVCHNKDGTSQTLPVGTVMRPATENYILGLAEAAGVQINDLQGNE